MGFERLKACDGRLRGLLSDWDGWLEQADTLYLRFLDRVGDSPFLYHEVASVGFLASAAAMAGFTPLAEYEIVKRARYDKRAHVDGRADLWFSSGPRAYSFEFKRAYVAATRRNLADVMRSASNDIACIQRDEYHYAAGAQIARVRDAHRNPTYVEFAKSDLVDLAYHLGPDGEGGAFLFFKLTC
jgi:hypothetical protein